MKKYLKSYYLKYFCRLPNKQIIYIDSTPEPRKFLNSFDELMCYLNPIEKKLSKIIVLSKIPKQKIYEHNNFMFFDKNNSKFNFFNLDDKKYQKIKSSLNKYIIFNDKNEDDKKNYIDYKKYHLSHSLKKESSKSIHVSNQFINKKKKEKLSNQNYLDLFKESKSKSILLLGSGPNLSKFRYEDFLDSDVMICNSLVKNINLLDILKPKYVVFSDPIFHAGPSKYAIKFREDLSKVINKYDPFIISNLRNSHIFSFYIKNLNTDKTIFLPDYEVGKLNYNLDKKFFVNSTNNILTLLMLPVAFNNYEKIFFAGFDGKNPKKNDYFWDHDKSVQYESELEGIKTMHPNNFERDYDDYFREHNNELDIWIKKAKEQKKELYNLTESFTSLRYLN